MGLKRDTLRHSAIYSVANVLGRMASFVMLPFYAYLFEAKGYGIIALIDASIGFLSVGIAAGSHNAILRTYHDERPERKGLVISSGIWTVWMFSALCVPIPALASPWISELLLGSSGYWMLILLALGTFLFDMGGQSASTFLVIRQQSLLYSAVNLLQLLLGLTLNIVLVVILRVGLVGIFVSSLIATGVASLIFHLAAVRAHGLAYDPVIGRRLRRYWFPLVPGELVAYVSRQVERYLVRFLVSLEGVGILEMAYKFPPLINLFIAHPFLRAWRTKSMEIGPQPDAPREIGSMFTLFAFLTLFAAVILAGTIGPLIEILAPPDFAPASGIARIEIGTTVAAAGTNYLMFGLLYAGRTGTITRIRSASAVVKVCLSTVLILWAGLAGAAWSALVMEVLVMLWMFRCSQQVFRVNLEYGKLALLGGLAVGLTVAIDASSIWGAGLLSSIERAFDSDVVGALGQTAVAHWRDGRVLEMVRERAYAFAHLLVGGTVSLLYISAILVIRPQLAHWPDRHFVRPVVRVLRAIVGRP